MELWCKNGPRNRLRRGRGIVDVGGTLWVWKVGRRGHHVVAYSEGGRRLLAHAADIKGVDPDVFERGQWKVTSDGMLTPADVAKWIEKEGAR